MLCDNENTYFKLDNMINSVNKITENILFPMRIFSSESKSRCHRGINLRVWLKINEYDMILYVFVHQVIMGIIVNIKMNVLVFQFNFELFQILVEHNL